MAGVPKEAQLKPLLLGLRQLSFVLYMTAPSFLSACKEVWYFRK